MSVDVPEGWREGRLKDLCEIVERRLGNKPKPEVLSVAKRGVVPQSQTYDKEIASEDVSRYRVIEPGEFGLAPMALYYGAIGRYRGTCAGIISPAYNVFRHRAGVDPDFLETLVRMPRMIARYDALSQGGNLEGKRKLTPYEAFETIKVYIPPLAEQRAIASMLGAIDAAVSKTEALVYKLKLRKNDILKTLPNPELVGCKVKLRSVVKSLASGVSVGGEIRTRSADEFGVLRTSSVSSGIFMPDQVKVIKSKDIQRASINPKSDCIIISRANTPELVGASAYVKDGNNSVFLSDKLWQIDVRDRKSVNSRWLSIAISSSRMRKMISLRANGTSSSMQNISKSAFLGLDIIMPPIYIQNNIAKIAEAFEVRQLKEDTYLEFLKLAREALASELLSGRKRLPASMIARYRDPPEQAA